ncbi:hypothetical protein BH11MYX3_BH11MYX3_28580 [soil metagenome]
MVQPGWSGRIIDGRYAVDSVIGSGGMGLVLKAHHKFTGADVAVKVLKNDLALDPQIQMRFLAEARAPNAIGHPGIVNVIDAGKAPDGLLYLVMELLQGRPLRVAMARAELTATDARRILLELLDALEAAHARGFVHRDLKPENVFLSGAQQQVKLLDFGIAKVLDVGLARGRTATNAQLGTPAYMAPEQFRDPSGVDARADLWAIGIMAYEMLAGRLPFRADTTQAMLIAIATQNFDPITMYLPSCPPAIVQFFDRALARDRAQRFATAVDMAMALGALPLGNAPPRQQGSSTGYAETARPPTGPTPQLGMQTPAPHRPPTGSTPHLGIPGTPVPNADATALIPQGASTRAWLIGLGLATAISIAVVIIAVMATRKTTPTAPDDRGPTIVSQPQTAVTDASVDAMAPPDASSAVAKSLRETAISVGFLDPNKKPKPPRDAGVGAAPSDGGTQVRTARQDAGTATVGPRDPYADTETNTPNHPPKDPPKNPPKDPPPRAVFTFEDQCRVGCAAAIKQCGNVARSCVTDCLARPKLRDCLMLPLGSCNEVAICGTRAVCGGAALQGSKTCAETARCQLTSCAPGDSACGCRCAAQMSWQHAQALAALDACTSNCGFNAECVAKNCSFHVNTCTKQ